MAYLSAETIEWKGYMNFVKEIDGGSMRFSDVEVNCGGGNSNRKGEVTDCEVTDCEFHNTCPHPTPPLLHLCLSACRVCRGNGDHGG